MVLQHCVSTALSTLSLLLAVFVGATESDGPSADTKENLDLPVATSSLSGTGDESTAELVVLWGQAFEGNGFYVCVDGRGASRSGVRSGVRRLLEQLSDGCRFAIVHGGVDVRRFPASGRPAAATATARRRAAAFIESFERTGDVRTREALLECVGIAQRSPVRYNHIFFFISSACLQSCEQAANAPACYAATLESIEALNRNLTPIHVVGAAPSGCSHGAFTGTCFTFLQALRSRYGGKSVRRVQ